MLRCRLLSVFFFNDTATTEIYTLSLHDALPISERFFARLAPTPVPAPRLIRLNDDLARHLGIDPDRLAAPDGVIVQPRSEEHTSELQSRQYLVCRLLLEKKKKFRFDINVRSGIH